MDAGAIPPQVLYILGYAGLLIAGLVVTMLVLHRLTREERAAVRRKSRREPSS